MKKAIKRKGRVIVYTDYDKYGIIEPDDGGGLISITLGVLASSGLLTLKAGDRVEFLSTQQPDAKTVEAATQINLIGKAGVNNNS